MVEKVKGYGYKNIGFILDRGYFSKQKGTFENDWGNQIAEFGVYGKTVHTFVYTADTKKRYVHIYYSAAKAAGERARLEESIQEMQSYLKRFQDTGHFVYGEPKLQVIRAELDLCGYFAIISSEKMDAKKAITLYKNRDALEKVFHADKSYLGNNCLRVASEEAASNKIFIGFIALIIRCKLYTALKDKAAEMVKKPNYLTVPAAIRELEKNEMTRNISKESLEQKIAKIEKAISKTVSSTIGLQQSWRSFTKNRKQYKVKSY